MPVVSPDVIAGITAEVLSLPPDVNPYSWLAVAMQERVLPHLSSPTFQVLMWLAFGLHAIALLCNMTTLVIRARGKGLWLFRKNSEGYIVSVLLTSLVQRLMF